MSAKINKFIGLGLVIKGEDIDTDQIMPAKFLKCLDFEDLGRYIFFDIKKQFKGTHPLDNPKYNDAEILIVNSNFGCGSSREHAPQGLKRYGFKFIIGESFSEIFYKNSHSIGMPCLILNKDQILKIQDYIQKNPNSKIEISIEKTSIKIDKMSFNFIIDKTSKLQFINGDWDLLKNLYSNLKGIEKKRLELEYLHF